jgi:hypothetical protein
LEVHSNVGVGGVVVPVVVGVVVVGVVDGVLVTVVVGVVTEQSANSPPSVLERL